MKDHNKVFFIGNLASDVNAKLAAEGNGSRASFRLATSRNFKPEGKDKPETDYHNIVLFGRNAEIAAEYLSKGSRVHIEGRLQNRDWVDKETGDTKYISEIVVDPMGLTMLDGARAADNAD